jgi:hypothetical protein
MFIQRKAEGCYCGLSAGIGKRPHLDKFECTDGGGARSIYLYRRIGTKSLSRRERQADQSPVFYYQGTAVHSACARRCAPYEYVHGAFDASSIQNELSHPATELSDDERVLSDQEVCSIHFDFGAIASLGAHS